MIPLLDLNLEYKMFKSEIEQSLYEVLKSGSFILGDKGKELEISIAKFIGTSHGIGLANGTDALLLSLEALGIGHNDEVITTTFSFFATAEVIARVGATPVFVDIDPVTYNMDPLLLENVITEKTKAIIVVHLFGQPADMDKILNISKRYNISVIEDTCQSIGATFGGKKVGSFGDTGCFSFFPTKNLGAYGDGGMVVTNKQYINEKICLLRNHGCEVRYIHNEIGTNSRLDELQAAILLFKLKMLNEWNLKRGKLASRYTHYLKPHLKTPVVACGRSHVFHQYCVELDDRDELALFLHKKQIATGIYYPVPLHLQEAFQYLKYKEGDFPVAEETSKRILALPMYPLMTKKQQDKVIFSINEFMSGER